MATSMTKGAKGASDSPIETDSFGSLFDALPVGAYRSRPDGSLIRANLALARLNGFRTLAELYPAVSDIGAEWYLDPVRRADFCRRLEHDGQLTGFVSEVRRYADGERIWVSENARLLRDADGRVIAYEGTVEDISERVQALQALADSERHLRQIADHIPGMAYRVHMPLHGGPGGYFSFVSPGVELLYGLEPSAVMADGELLRLYRHPDDDERVDAEITAAVREARTAHAAFRILVRGQLKWVQMSSSPVSSDDVEQVRVGVLLDITAQHQAEAMRRDRDRAEAARRQMTQFLSRVSHELRTPLNAILGFAQLIEMEPDTPSLQRRWAASLLDSGRHLLELVNDVLDITGAQSGQMRVDATPVDVAQVLGEAWAMVRADADARQLRFAGVPPLGGPLQVIADRRRMLQVLVNLLNNAVKYNRPGGPVTLDIQRAEGRVSIAVGDGGAGISTEGLARLFTPFDRLGVQHGSVPGTGLGLALSRQLAEAMGGSIDVASEPGVGSVFTLRLPAAG